MLKQNFSGEFKRVDAFSVFLQLLPRFCPSILPYISVHQKLSKELDIFYETILSYFGHSLFVPQKVVSDEKAAKNKINIKIMQSKNKTIHSCLIAKNASTIKAALAIHWKRAFSDKWKNTPGLLVA